MFEPPGLCCVFFAMPACANDPFSPATQSNCAMLLSGSTMQGMQTSIASCFWQHSDMGTSS